VNYEFRNPVLAAVASRVFSRMFGEILDAFERRAIQLFPTETPRVRRVRGDEIDQQPGRFHQLAATYHKLKKSPEEQALISDAFR